MVISRATGTAWPRDAERGHPRARNRRERAWRVAVAFVLAISTTACSRAEIYGGRNEGRDVLDIRTVVGQWLVSNYEPAESLGAPEAFCLSAPAKIVRNTPRDRGLRSTGQDPDPRLLRNLGRFSTPVLPQSACEIGDSQSEVVSETRGRGIALWLGYPVWTTPDVVEIRVGIRENWRIGESLRCTLIRDADTRWELRRCL